MLELAAKKPKDTDKCDIHPFSRRHIGFANTGAITAAYSAVHLVEAVRVTSGHKDARYIDEQVRSSIRFAYPDRATKMLALLDASKFLTTLY